MRVLLTSDLHFGGSRYQKIDSRGVNLYMTNVFDSFEFIVRWVEDAADTDKAIDIVLIAGDIFDRSNITTYALYRAKELFDRLRAVVPQGVKAIFGNHDLSDLLKALGFTAIDLIPSIDVYNDVETVETGGINIVFAPWGKIDDVTDDHLSKGVPNMLVAHGFPKPAWFVPEDSKDVLPSEITEKFDVVFTGHSHATDVFTKGKTLYLNPGSIAPSGSSKDEHSPCFFVMDTDDLSYEVVLIENAMKFVRERFDDVNKMHEFLEGIEEGDNGIYRIEAIESPDKSILARAQKNATDIRISVLPKEREKVEKVDDFWDFIKEKYPDYEEDFKARLVETEA